MSVESTYNGDASFGGIVGAVQKNSTLNMTDCLFNGNLLGPNASNCGGLVGTGSDNTSYNNISKCLFAPSTITMKATGSYTISRCTNNLTIGNSYYTQQFGTAQGDLYNPAEKTVASLVSALGDRWIAGNIPYLKSFARYVDITGWATDHTPNDPVLNNYSLTDTKYYYKEKTASDDTYSETRPSTEGHYTVMARMDGGWETTKDFWIIAPPTANELNYTGADQTLLTASTTAGAGTFFYRLGTTGEWSTTIPKAKNVGSYTVYYYVKSTDTQHNDIGTPIATAGTVEVKIKEKTLNSYAISLDPVTFVFDRTEKKPTVIVKDGDVVVDPSEYTYTYSNNINTGTAKVVVTDVPYGTYTVNGEVTFTITPKPLPTPVVTLSPSSVTYTGLEQKPVATVKDGDVVIPTSEYTVNYVSNTNAGTGQVQIINNADGNYTLSFTTVNFEIKKAQLGCTPPKGKTLTYTKEPQELVTAGTISGAGSTADCSMKYCLDGQNYSVAIPTGTAAKTYTVYYRVDGDMNHEGIVPASLNVTITPKQLSASAITISPTSFVYDGTAKEPAVSVLDGDSPIPPSEYTVAYSNNMQAGTATVTVTNNPGANYIINGSAQFAIVTADATYVPPTAKGGLIYNTTAQELVTAGTATGGSMLYSLDGKTYTSTIPTGTDAKEYTVYYKVEGDPNHSDMTRDPIKVTISSKTIGTPVIVVTPSAIDYDGKAKTPTVTVRDGDTVIPASEYTLTYSDNVNVGTATVKIEDKPDGNYTVNGSATFLIVDPVAAVKAPQPKTGLEYNGKMRELIVAGVAPDGVMVYSLDGKTYSLTIPTAKDAGNYKVWYKVVDNDGVDKTTAKTVTATINPKNVNISIVLTGRGVQMVPAVTVVDEFDSVLDDGGYQVVYQTTSGKEVKPTNGRLPEGDYVVIVRPVGNYSGPSISTTFHVRGELSFVFTIQSDLITVCLPFSRSLPASYQAYCFDRLDDQNNPVFKELKTTLLSAGEPYLLKYIGTGSGTRGNRVLDLSPDNPAIVDLSTPIREQMNGDIIFTGLFDDMTNKKGVSEGAYILQNNNSWKASASKKEADASKICLDAFHAYLHYRNHSTPTEELTVTVPGIVVAINSIILEDEDGEQTWYDLNGRRIDGPQRGVNILRMKSGQTRKVVIR